MTTTLRARYDGKVLVPQGPVDLPPGQEVELRVTPITDPPLGSAAAILKVMDELPPIPQEDVDELMRLIDEDKRPVDDRGAFDDVQA
jgi:hypothetical protein